MPKPKQKPKQEPVECDRKTCGSCDSYRPVNPGDDAGFCHLMPPVWCADDGDAGWSRPVVEPHEAGCRFYLRKLQS